MNISRRLPKIEERLNVNKSSLDVCGCYIKFLLGSIYPHIEKPYNDYPNLKKRFCDTCKMPISKRDIKLENKILMIYGDKTN